MITECNITLPDNWIETVTVNYEIIGEDEQLYTEPYFHVNTITSNNKAIQDMIDGDEREEYINEVKEQLKN